MELASRQNRDLVSQAKDNRDKLSTLHSAYLGTIESELARLDAADKAAATFQLSHCTKPKDEAAASKLSEVRRTAAQTLKAERTAFLTATNNMQTALRGALSALHGDATA